MRKFKKNGKIFLAGLMVLMLAINLFSVISARTVSADSGVDAEHFKDYNLEATDGVCELTEKSENYNDGSFDVEMTVSGGVESTNIDHSLDLVLVVDSSDSMNQLSGGRTRFDITKEVAKNLVNKLLSSGKTGVRIAVVGYGFNVTKKTDLISDKAAINKAIDDLTLDGTTYTQGGLNVANDILSTSNADQKRVVLLSDGIPTTAFDGVSDGFKAAVLTNSDKESPEYKIYHREFTAEADPATGRLKIKSQGDFVEGYNPDTAARKEGNIIRFYKNYRIYPGRIGNGLSGNPEVNRLTYAAAENVKKNAVLSTIGIDVYGDGENILAKIAENSGGYYSSKSIDDSLKNILNKLSEEIIDKKINKGKFVIPMAEYVNFRAELSYMVVTDNKKNEALTKEVKVDKPTDTNNNLVFSNLTLGKNEKLIVRYKAELIEERKDDEFYNITASSPMLYPLPYVSEKTSIGFEKVMQVKDYKTVNIGVTKIWNQTPDELKANVDVELYERTGDKEFISTGVNVTIAKEENAENHSNGGFADLPMYDKKGNKIEYQIKESGIDENGKVKIGDAYFTVKTEKDANNENNWIITNTYVATQIPETEKKSTIDIEVNKVWDENVPESEKEVVEVAVFDGENIVSKAKLNSAKGWSHTFKELPVIEGGYSVKETGINGVVADELRGKLYEISGEKTGIIESETVTINNKFIFSDHKCCGVAVTKLWGLNAVKKEINIALYKKENGKWEKYGQASAPGTETVEKIENIGCNVARSGRPSDASLPTPGKKNRVLAKHAKGVAGRVYALSDGQELEGTGQCEIISIDGIDVVALETKVGTEELTEDEIKTILKSYDSSKHLQYKIGGYKVSVQKVGENGVFFIKNTADKEFIEVNVSKQWSQSTTEEYKKPVKVQLYAKKDESLIAVGEAKELNSPGWSTEFSGLDKKDGEELIKYYVFETEIGGVPVAINPLTATGYETDAVGRITYVAEIANKGGYNVTITGNIANGEDVVINNEYVPATPDNNIPPTPPVPEIPQTPAVSPIPDVPPTTPVIPVTPDVPLVPPTPVTPEIPELPTPTGPNIIPDPEDPQVNVSEDITPEGKTDKNKNVVRKLTKVKDGGNEVIDEDKTPRGVKKLPRTGGSTGALLSIAGLVLIGLAFVFRKRK